VPWYRLADHRRRGDASYRRGDCPFLPATALIDRECTRRPLKHISRNRSWLSLKWFLILAVAAVETGGHSIKLNDQAPITRDWHVRLGTRIQFRAENAALSRADEHQLLLISRAAGIHNEYFLDVGASAHSRRKADHK